MSKKVTGWVMAYKINGIPLLLFVSAKGRIAAIAKFEEAGYEVVDSNEIRHSVIVKYPGPPEVQEMERMDWQNNSEAGATVEDVQ